MLRFAQHDIVVAARITTQSQRLQDGYLEELPLITSK